ncbi:MAG: [Fe-Fe] hydrogenase large subunit C-terminal domain-containing protein [Firmicutes bacterium]|nr:[Fe-Fe] hydrogenase large subunit C-terminal domain-containing protein [Bacillota bacterium]
MEHCLQTKKSDCKNCYKCIRHCPVKSLRMTEGQAHIMRDECILCGECYVVCPQNAKEVRCDIERAKALIECNDRVVVSLAPSYAAVYPEYSFDDIRSTLLKLGFDDAEETAIGATIVKNEYERIIKEREQEIIISTCCPSVNMLVEKHFKNALPYLANVVSPVQAHAMAIKKADKTTKVVFIGPCISKKAEAEKYEGHVDVVLTFDELDSWLETEKIEIVKAEHTRKKHRTNLFPTSGGILKSMDHDDSYRYVVIDGTQKCIDALNDIEKGGLKNCFIEMSACGGSCISGPIMRKRNHNPVVEEVSVAREIEKDDYFVEQPPKNELVKRFNFEGKTQVMPGSAVIEEILHKMGKNTREQELNCGSCGYNTCREKAVAIFQGKADISMCMPYLKEKAESFSDNIVNNTPNGIIVLDEQLNIQSINKAAKCLLNLPNSADLIGSPVVRILDPIDYLLAFNDGKNVYDNRKYLAEYQKYVEETIICDKEYHIIMIMIKDISDEEKARSEKEEKSRAAVEITDKVIDKQMRIVQEIASLLGETTAETKIALTKLKETLSDE